MSTLALLLAAGRGSRMGTPKALVRGEDGTAWLHARRDALLEAGCDGVLVVLGASADEALALLGDHDHVIAPDWADGMSASLRAGLREAESRDVDAVLVHLVDLPDVGADVVRRLLAYAGPEALARATYGGRPGHPVVVGRSHWRPLLADLDGDVGAKGYLARHATTLVECADLATGDDVDTPEGTQPT